MIRLFEILLDLLYPPKCTFCGKLLGEEEHDICTACRLELPIRGDTLDVGPYLEACSAALYYRGKVREAVLRFKFHGMEQYASTFAPLLAAAASAQLPMDGIDAVTWVPVSRKRRRKRGYDQAYLLARLAAKQLGKPLESTLLKQRDNPAQSGITAPEERRANVLNAYRLARGADVADKAYLLVDDVVTTGSTIGEAARVLLTAGAKAVYGAALASGRLEDDTSSSAG